MDAYIEMQREAFFTFARNINAKASNICRWNYKTRKKSIKFCTNLTNILKVNYLVNPGLSKTVFELTTGV